MQKSGRKKKEEKKNMKTVQAPDIKQKIIDIIEKLDLHHIDSEKVVCMRSTGSKARAYARVWAFPKIWQQALNTDPHYIVEVLSQHYDKLPEEEKQKVLIHELMHIPKTFSGALVPHLCFGKRIDRKSVDALFKDFKKAPERVRITDDGTLEML